MGEKLIFWSNPVFDVFAVFKFKLYFPFVNTK